jgi:BirA family biotin operon repressor/biotin-[acetyl-CoA-carboxylase] ligase
LPAEAVVGVATEVDDAGHLIVLTDAGPRVVAAGDVVHLRPA